MKYVGFGKRFLAYLIDTIIIYSFTSIVPNQELKNFLDSFLWLPYFVWMNGMYGASIGKMILGIKIVKENGKKINYSDALLREIASILSMIVFMLGFLNVLWDPKKQSWHDKIAKTLVVEK